MKSTSEYAKDLIAIAVTPWKFVSVRVLQAYNLFVLLGDKESMIISQVEVLC